MVIDHFVGLALKKVKGWNVYQVVSEKKAYHEVTLGRNSLNIETNILRTW